MGQILLHENFEGNLAEVILPSLPYNATAFVKQLSKIQQFFVMDAIVGAAKLAVGSLIDDFP